MNMASKHRVKYYFNPNGLSPVEKFLNSLKPTIKSKIIRTFQIIEDFGPQLVRNKIKKLSGTPLWEIKISGKNTVRMIYFYHHHHQLLILHGFIKKTQKTPKKEIHIALKRYYHFLDN
jgi:phage-related protein